MMHAFLRSAGGEIRRLSSPGELVARRADDIVWLDFEAPSAEDLHGVRDLLGFDASAIADCLSGEQRPRIDEFEDHLVWVVYGLFGSEGDDLVGPRKLVAFCGERFLVTVHRDSLRAIDDMLGRCEANPAHFLGRGADHILYLIIDRVVDRYVQVAERYEESLEELEESSRGPDAGQSTLDRASALRHDILGLRRLAFSQRELLAPVADGEYDYLSVGLERRFGHIVDHLAHVVELADAMLEHLRAVHQNYAAVVAERTNTVMRRLTVIATILLPLTLVAGIYGMNLPVWPSGDQPASFWVVIGFMAALALGLLLVFRRKRWF